jgi:hypothetical protein
MDSGGAAFQGGGDGANTRTFSPEGGHLLDQLEVVLDRWSPQSPALSPSPRLACLHPFGYALVLEGSNRRQDTNHSVPHRAC